MPMSLPKSLRLSAPNFFVPKSAGFIFVLTLCKLIFFIRRKSWRNRCRIWMCFLRPNPALWVVPIAHCCLCSTETWNLRTIHKHDTWACWLSGRTIITGWRIWEISTLNTDRSFRCSLVTSVHSPASIHRSNTSSYASHLLNNTPAYCSSKIQR